MLFLIFVPTDINDSDKLIALCSSESDIAKRWAGIFKNSNLKYICNNTATAA